ncbi:MAG TPA: adenosylcobinamide-phosphate synthase CbiB [Solirubrobacteraceae bacterium]|nr:adenosylcobinamide-phosphate synthase CbiB [Solirubrobacteraceae bacterium]
MSSGARDARALLIGFALDRALGDMPRAHPVALFGALAGRLERRTWAPRRSAGAAHLASLLATTALLARAARGGALRDGLLIWVTLGGRSLERAARHMAGLLHAGDLAAARLHARTLVGRQTAELDCGELCRATIESVAENSADALVGALLWGGLAGPAGAALYRAANTLDAMIGHRCERYERFGWAAARLDDLLGWPGARLAALLAVALAPLAGGDVGGAWRVLRRDGAAHPSPNAGRVEAAYAGALGVRLGGANRYAGRSEVRPTLGEGRVPQIDDIDAAVRLCRLVGYSALAICVLLALARDR